MFKQEARQFIIIIISKINERTPSCSLVVMCAVYLDPSAILVRKIDMLKDLFKKLLNHLLPLMIISVAVAEKALTLSRPGFF